LLGGRRANSLPASAHVISGAIALTPPIPFIDLLAQRRRLGARIDAAVMRVVDSGQYVLGPEVRQLEQRLAAYAGAAHCLSCANGTDAIALPLLAWGIGPGDAVFCPSFTFAATPEVVAWLGAEPVFVDIDPDTYNLNPAHLDVSIEMIARKGALKPKAVIAVDLFGQLADYPAIAEITRRHGLKLIADSAQGFGATLGGAHPIAWADAQTTSFFPAKPLGCYGDGGAVLANDAELAELIDSLRVHGKATGRDARQFAHDPKYLNPRVGMNSRLDTIQAAILLEKLDIFEEEIGARQLVADRYAAGLGNMVKTPTVIAGGRSVWAQYTIETQDRSGVAASLKERGVPTAVYYPIPMHRQPAYAGYVSGPGGLPVTEAAAERVISLPMHPYLSKETQAHIVESVRDSLVRKS
jgi:dTDP-4-amino-4,6-dideoxygalactose transaminase